MIAKRIFDLFFVVPSLLILLPMFVLIAFLIRKDSAGPVLFRQKRIGKAGQPFWIYKFRTMVINAESLGAKVTIGKDPRVTRIGEFLRKYKLDELPQFINVLKGEMSLVGPRPEVPEYVAYWPAEIRDLILSVPPGITDYASIEFRNENELLGEVADPVEVYIRKIMPIKLEYCVKYVKNRSIFLDFWLVLRTIAAVFR